LGPYRRKEISKMKKEKRKIYPPKKEKKRLVPSLSTKPNNNRLCPGPNAARIREKGGVKTILIRRIAE